MFVCPTVSELRFYGCCYHCLVSKMNLKCITDNYIIVKKNISNSKKRNLYYIFKKEKFKFTNLDRKSCLKRLKGFGKSWFDLFLLYNIHGEYKFLHKRTAEFLKSVFFL